MKREITSDKFPIGSALPEFTLSGVKGVSFDSRNVKIDRGLLVVFSCNHCPYVKGTEAELISIVKQCSSEGLGTIAINSNDPAKYPEDSFENMEKKAVEMQLPYFYLMDETQDVARKFDAACTPEAYLFDKNRQLVYHGSINDSPKDPAAAKTSFLRQAVEQLLSGKPIDPQFVHPIGCSIKWK